MALQLIRDGGVPQNQLPNDQVPMVQLNIGNRTRKRLPSCPALVDNEVRRRRVDIADTVGNPPSHDQRKTLEEFVKHAKTCFNMKMHKQAEEEIDKCYTVLVSAGTMIEKRQYEEARDLVMSQFRQPGRIESLLAMASEEAAGMIALSGGSSSYDLNKIKKLQEKVCQLYRLRDARLTSILLELENMRKGTNVNVHGLHEDLEKELEEYCAIVELRPWRFVRLREQKHFVKQMEADVLGVCSSIEGHRQDAVFSDLTRRAKSLLQTVQAIAQDIDVAMEPLQNGDIVIRSNEDVLDEKIGPCVTRFRTLQGKISIFDKNKDLQWLGEAMADCTTVESLAKTAVDFAIGFDPDKKIVVHQFTRLERMRSTAVTFKEKIEQRTTCLEGSIEEKRAHRDALALVEQMVLDVEERRKEVLATMMTPELVPADGVDRMKGIVNAWALRISEVTNCIGRIRSPLENKLRDAWHKVKSSTSSLFDLSAQSILWLKQEIKLEEVFKEEVKDLDPFRAQIFKYSECTGTRISIEELKRALEQIDICVSDEYLKKLEDEYFEKMGYCTLTSALQVYRFELEPVTADTLKAFLLTSARRNIRYEQIQQKWGANMSVERLFQPLFVNQESLTYHEILEKLKEPSA